MRTLVVLAIGLIALSCSSIKVYVRKDENADFSQYKTFAFLQRPPEERVYGSLLAENEMIYGIQEELEARGLKADTVAPDLLISFKSKAQVSQKQITSTPPMWVTPMWGLYDPFFWGPAMMNSWTQRQTQLITEAKGTIELFFFERQSKKAVWQGAAIGNADNPYENVRRSLQKLFSKFPLKRLKPYPKYDL
ncbi:MAG: DUF4136 domain-containing protein [Cytophagales bacterium]|nr:DUF4136 domain-containing protein [Bernardetiaceae bacterium]MDW8211575.1 DUF4136 domain-containing protein [Cytophagales bacterium]